MAELTVHIHCKGKEKHEVTTPEDIVAEEFIAELVSGLRLPTTDEKGQVIVWEADDKDSGHKLTSGKTLRDNGVLNGHNLYLRSTKPAQPIFTPIPDLPEKGEPRREPVTIARAAPQWPLMVAVALIPIAALGGYFGARSQSGQILQQQLNAERAVAESAKKKTADAEARLAQVEAEAQKLQRDVQDRDSSDTTLKTSLAAAQAQSAAKDKRISQLSADLVTARADAARINDEQIKRLAASAQRVQALQSQLAAAQQEMASAREKIQPLQQELSNLQRLLASERSRQKIGIVTWTGDPKKNVVEIIGNRTPSGGAVTGSLPGTECTIRSADPEKISFTERPGPENKWNRVAFRVAGSGRATVLLIWEAK